MHLLQWPDGRKMWTGSIVVVSHNWLLLLRKIEMKNRNGRVVVFFFVAMPRAEQGQQEELKDNKVVVIAVVVGGKAPDEQFF